MDLLPNDILLQIALRVNVKRLRLFFCLGRKYNYTHNNLFWSLRCEYEFNYPRDTYLKYKLNDIDKYRALRSNNLDTHFDAENIEMFSFLSYAPKNQYEDYQEYFDRAILFKKMNMIKLLIDDYRVNPNLSVENIESSVSWYPHQLRPILETKYVNMDILDIFLACSRFDPCAQDNFLFKKYMNVCGVIEKLVKYPQIDSLLTDDYICNMFRNHEYLPILTQMVKSMFSDRVRRKVPLLEDFNKNTETAYECIVFTLDLPEYYENLRDTFNLIITHERINNMLKRDAVNILEHILYKIGYIPDWSLILDHGILGRVQSSKMLKLILEHPTYIKNHFDVVNYGTLVYDYNGKLLEILVKYPLYKNELQLQSHTLLNGRHFYLDFVKVFVNEFDYVLKEKCYIEPLLQGKNIYGDKLKDSKEILELWLNHKKIDFSESEDHPLRTAIEYNNIEVCKLLLESPLIEIDDNIDIIMDVKIDFNNVSFIKTVRDVGSIFKHFEQIALNSKSFTSYLVYKSLPYPKITKLLLKDSRFILSSFIIEILLNKNSVSIIKSLLLNPSFKTYVENKPEELYNYIGCTSTPEILKLFLDYESFDVTHDVIVWVGLCMTNTDKLDLCLLDHRIGEVIDYDKLKEACIELGHIESLKNILFHTSECNKKIEITKEHLFTAIENNRQDMVIHLLNKYKFDISDIKEDLLDEAEVRCMDKLIKIIENYKC